MIDSDRDRLVGLLAAREKGGLGAEEEAELSRALDRDPQAAALAGGDRMIDRLLRYAARTDLGADEFTRGVVARVDAERRGDAFVRRVSRAARKLPVRRKEPEGRWAALGLAAACAVIVLLSGIWGPTDAPIRKLDAASVPKLVPAERQATRATPPSPLASESAPAPKKQAETAAPDPLPVEPRRPESQPDQRDPEPVAPTPATPKATIATIGTVERVEGSVTVRAGTLLLAGQSVETGPKGSAVLRLLDGTRIDLSEGTCLVSPDGNNRFLLTRGSLLADVAKQPKGSALLFGTPNAEATVLGTTLRLTVGPGEKGSTRLEVLEGKVRLARSLDGKSVDVPSGHFAVAIDGTELKARPLPDPRVTEGLRALYVFEEGKGRIIRDVSGVGSPLQLVAKDESDLAWLPGGGLALRAPTLLASPGAATKIISACRTSRAITVEAWIRPSQVEKGTLRYVAALSGPRKESMAFGLGLHCDIGSGPTTYRAYLTTPKTVPPSDQMPDLESVPIVPALAHIVFTRTAAGLATLYVDGIERGSAMIDGDFSNWSDTLRVMLGDYSFEGVRPWQGEFHLLAFYSRALRMDEVSQNYEAGKRKFASRK